MISKDFGVVHTSWERIAEELAKRQKFRIAPTPWYAQNKLGLSTQVPMRVVFMTDGKSKVIHDLKGRQVLRLIHSDPKNFDYKSDLVQLIVFALEDYGEKYVKEIRKSYEMKRIKSLLLEHENEETVLSDLKLAPTWIQKTILSFYK